jgi:hypothetical protein
MQQCFRQLLQPLQRQAADADLLPGAQHTTAAAQLAQGEIQLTLLAAPSSSIQCTRSRTNSASTSPRNHRRSLGRLRLRKEEAIQPPFPLLQHRC